MPNLFRREGGIGCPPDPETIVSYHMTLPGSLFEHYRQDLYLVALSEAVELPGDEILFPETLNYILPT